MSAALAASLADLEPVADPSAADTGPAGMAHLFAAKLAARTGGAADAAEHLDQARELAEWTGERNTAWQHFGPTNVALWTLAVGADLGHGGAGYERASAPPSTWMCSAVPPAARTTTWIWLALWCRRTGP